MKRALLLLALLAASINLSVAKPIRVLFLGHDNTHHNSNAYLPLLMEAMGRDAIYFDYFTTPDCLNAETLSHYDAVMLYANHERMVPWQFEALNQFVESGKGFLPIHCASACFGNDPRFIALVGGRFASHGTGVFKPTIVDRSHPIMQGVNEWETWDETYVHDQHNSTGRKILMERVEGDKREPWTWVREQGKGRVFYTASGHDQRTWENRDFQKMLQNAIVWSIGDARRAQWESFVKQREPEKREPNPNVANYERRPEPVTFQHAMSVKGSMERTQVPADMRLELFASEPDISKPIALAWDDRGRCWVAETSDYPHVVNADGKGGDRIKICEDTNGDGKADKFTVFAEGLNIPTSLVFANGGVIVAQPPRFIFLKDTNGDDRADVSEVIMEGWGIGDTHAQASSLHWGFDNWLYGCVGYSGFKGTVGGKALSFQMGTYRFKADGSQLEFLHQFSNNSWGHSTNIAGDQFGGTANNAPIFYGGIPATAFPPGMRGMNAKRINVEDKAHAITPNYRQVDVFGGYTSAAGTSFIYSKNLPPRLQGKAMVTEPTMKIVALMDVQPSGAGYVAKDGFNLLASTDEWMSPVFAEVGPDGAVWVADWQNFIIQHNPTPSRNRGGYDAKTGVGGAHENPLRDHSRGRIYRVVWDKATAPAIKSLNGASTSQLVAALSSDNQFWRLTAQRLLVESRKADGASALRRVVSANNGDIGAVHALWVLHGTGGLDAATHQSALAAKDPALRRNAIRALGSSPESQQLFFGSGVIADADPHTRLAAFVKLSEFPTTDEIRTLVVQLSRDPEIQKDEWLRESIKLLGRKHNAIRYTEGPNLLPNPGFEVTGPDGLPEGWKRRDYGSRPANDSAEWTIVTAPGQVHSGSKAFRVITRGDADTSFYADVDLKPNTQYRLAGWVKTRGLRGKASFNDHIGRHETERITSNVDWTQIEVVFNSGSRPRASINLLHVARGDTYFDDVRLCEVTEEGAMTEPVIAGDVTRGENIFFKHAAAACVLCHQLKGQGSTVGPPLDGLASKRDAKYIEESLLEPNKVLSEGYQALGASPMPPMGLVLKPQELADLKAYLQTLK
jgi:putative membrane-bound dehydrogenase-like protein